MKRPKRVSSCGPHRIEEERRVLLFLGVREGLFLLQFFDQFGIRVWEGCRGGGGGAGGSSSSRVVRLLFVAGLACRPVLRRLCDGPCESGPWGVVRLVLAQDVQ
jgi:hypothetical protein